MSESYLSGGNDWQDLGGSKYGAQSFFVTEEHILRYIDLELDSQVKYAYPWVKVYRADLNGHPLQPPESTSITATGAPNSIRTPYRCRVTMRPFKLKLGLFYVMVVHTDGLRHWYNQRWQYQDGGATYLHGWRLHSGDNGETWSEDWADDHMFAEFGNPPVFEVPYNPPPLYWALVYIAKNTYNTSTCYRFGTSSPVTMTLHVTENKPKPMEKFKIVRGTKTRCLDYYAFNEWRYYLQKEKGDSLYHTFHVKELKEAKRFWMVNTAESDANPSLSISPLLVSTHPGGPPFTTVRRPNAPGSLCTIPYQIGHPCPDHYLNINEPTPDEEASHIFTAYPWRGVWKQDLYHIPPYDMDPRPIKELQLTLRVKYQGNRYTRAGYQWLIKTHGLIFPSGIFGDLELSYENRHKHYTTNPFTNQPWTPAEIDDLQIGVGLWYNTGIGWSAMSFCTQVYATIKHKCEKFE